MGEMSFGISSLSLFDGFPTADDSPLQDVVYKILFLAEASTRERTAASIVVDGGITGAEEKMQSIVCYT
jgi:hypothetical protein